jgi:hypothetical protein
MKHLRSGSYIYFHGHPPSLPTYDADLVLLLHFDGTPGSRVFIDSSPHSQRINVAGSGYPQISSDQSKFGGTSCYNNNNLGWLNIPGINPDFTITGDFTMDIWVYPLVYNQVHWSVYYWNNPVQTHLGVINSSSRQYWYTNSTGYVYGQTVQANEWTHLAATRQTGTLRVFTNGVLISTRANYNDVISADSGYPRFCFSSVAGISCYFDELRILNGRAEWTASFTPPTAPYLPP